MNFIPCKDEDHKKFISDKEVYLNHKQKIKLKKVRAIHHSPRSLIKNQNKLKLFHESNAFPNISPEFILTSSNDFVNKNAKSNIKINNDKSQWSTVRKSSLSPELNPFINNKKVESNSNKYGFKISDPFTKLDVNSKSHRSTYTNQTQQPLSHHWKSSMPINQFQKTNQNSETAFKYLQPIDKKPQESRWFSNCSLR